MNKFQKKIYDCTPFFIKQIAMPSCLDILLFIRKSSFEIAAGSRVLDAGAGQCQYRDFFKDHKYIAIDSCCGDKTWDYSGLDIICNLEKVPFRDGIFDSVVCTQVLEHVKEPLSILMEVNRILKKGGYIYLSAPQGWGLHQIPNDYYRFTCYVLEYLFEKAGLKIIYIKPSCGYFSYLANRLTILPKILFGSIKNILLRLVLFPLEISAYILFVLLFPFILNAIDFLDKERNYTLNYFVKAQKLTE